MKYELSDSESYGSQELDDSEEEKEEEEKKPKFIQNPILNETQRKTFL